MKISKGKDTSLNVFGLGRVISYNLIDFGTRGFIPVFRKKLCPDFEKSDAILWSTVVYTI